MTTIAKNGSYLKFLSKKNNSDKNYIFYEFVLLISIPFLKYLSYHILSSILHTSIHVKKTCG